jgi:hypothetical protein
VNYKTDTCIYIHVQSKTHKRKRQNNKKNMCFINDKKINYISYGMKIFAMYQIATLNLQYYYLKKYIILLKWLKSFC